MAAGKWIGGIMGFMQGGPLGALAGFALGWLFDKGIDAVNTVDTPQETYSSRRPYTYQQTNRRQQATHAHAYEEGQRNSFLFAMLTLASYIIRSDGKVMHSEMEIVRNFLRMNFGSIAVSEGEQILLKLFEHQKQVGWQQFRTTIYSACQQINHNMNYAQRLQLLNFLVLIAQADGRVVTEEINALKDIAAHLGLSNADVESMLNLRDSSSNLDAAYKVLGIAPTATDDEVKKAYRNIALKHHPDRVAGLGEDVRRAAEQKFQEINNAKELIDKARNL